ncbi:FAD-binding oxidoreductase [Micromonospora sp. NBC_01813]|uniref:FAD-binding oxidoreductase n=1 Tax=Micromonospora sp. NBC_01813 TaxID=2975988 RepID=UPI002DD7D5CA|nr:FAD-binding oxidoreductase [Micromonospora sp. NBC_01813]WSA12811.1 FAD-binding oxidoreductase [Micromonospora sp. NBC_01813]
MVTTMGGDVVGQSDVAARLGDICGSPFVRRAGPDDAVATTAPDWVVAPGTVGAVAEVLRLAADRDLAVVPRGSGSKLDWGATPSHVDVMLDTGRLSGIWHHPPGSAAARVGAGTTLRAAQQAVGRTGWRISLDPPSPSATLGGIIAADEAGPLSHQHGSPCRQVIGVDYVDATGELVRAVPETDDGDELPGLLCGSQGALAVLVSATVRLQPAPASRQWVRRGVTTPLEAHDLVSELTETGLHPAAIELDLPAGSSAAARPGRTGSLAVLFEGDPASTRHRAAGAVTLLGGDASAADQPPTWWQHYPFAAGDIAIRLDVPPAHLYAAIYALRDAFGAPVAVRGCAGTGLVHATLPGSTAPDRVAGILSTVRTVLAARRGTCVVLTAPAEVRRAIDLWGQVPDLTRLRELKQRFDPRHRLAPGRLTGGL